MIKTILVASLVSTALVASAAIAYSKMKADLIVIETNDPVEAQIARLEVCFAFPKGSTNQHLCVKAIIDEISSTQEIKEADSDKKQVEKFSPCDCSTPSSHEA